MDQFHTTQNPGPSSGMLLGVLVSVALWMVMAAARSWF